MKSHYEHLSSCIQEFQTKVYQRKNGCKLELKESDSHDEQHNSSDDIIEVIMEKEGMVS